MKLHRIALLLACVSFAGEIAFRSIELRAPRASADRSFPQIATVAVAEATPLRKPPLKLHPDVTRAMINHAAKEHRISPALVKSIMAAESNFDCNALSDKGAVGLMQLMPETAAQYGADPAVPEQNVRAGAGYLRWLLDRYGKNRDGLKRTIAAYNAGPGNVDKYKGIPPFKETRSYVKRVMTYFREFSKESGEKIAGEVRKRGRLRVARAGRSGPNS